MLKYKLDLDKKELTLCEKEVNLKFTNFEALRYCINYGLVKEGMQLAEKMLNEGKERWEKKNVL